MSDMLQLAVDLIRAILEPFAIVRPCWNGFDQLKHIGHSRLKNYFSEITTV